MRAWGARLGAAIQANMRSIPQRAVIQLMDEVNEAIWKKKLLAEIDQALTQAGQAENYTKEAIENEPALGAGSHYPSIGFFRFR
ncbi:hypothetical protein SAMN06265784_101535 [Paraburkholderia susongensis]|uniref:Uncharacterized protein n=2 Tax=Paraburkholderia susongensis TaxID=1515439 RepID=A0A1X7ID58_9BURK|nr:hypothetical protein SAMN06265784_101535 [Paraburkholderia susongensis]